MAWLLGYLPEQHKTTLSTSSSLFVTGKSVIDIYGPNYFYITLDEFNYNRPNSDLISIVDNQVSSFKLPDYFNSQTMDPRYAIQFPGQKKYEVGHDNIAGFECVDVANIINNDRGCSENALNTDLASNLTEKQKYTVEQLQLARKSDGINRYYSPNSTDLFCRININIPRSSSAPVIYEPSNPELVAQRMYFGPVKITKFKVRLLHPFGFDVNLRGRDWSFSIVVNRHYQY